ncbi:sigma-70 family RNA polymerase sigma factor [Mumia sp. DW29H23]|uniref:sigma-70 family RNA polymerase sigma factor n=1 Tax=Mumia sp. DW29H23 TaxID=3421241 RepID=UPI003D6981D0
MTDLAAAHDRLRPLMFSIAYRLLDNAADAEDVVQEAFLRIHRDGPAAIGNLDAYASTVTSRVALDLLRSARARHEQCVGRWVPDGIVASDDATGDPVHRLELDETVSNAVLVLQAALPPVERAVFVLREVIGDDYDDIAAVVDKSATNCRQILARAKKRIADLTR